MQTLPTDLARLRMSPKRRSGHAPAVQERKRHGRALSGIVVVPAYLLLAESNIPSARWGEIAVQVLFQGVLMCGAYLAVHKAVLLVGGARVTMIMAVLTLLAGRAIAGDRVTPAETMAIATISGGILYGALWRLRGEGSAGGR
jgi:drug/metabolite transporter (DMT)-like permease